MSISRSAFPFALAMGVSFFAALVWAAGPDPGLNVTVTNPPTQPVPVTGTIAVGNSATNPLSVEGSVDTVAADKTATILAQFILVTDTFDGNHIIGPINVSDYKTIRIVANRGSCTGCADPVRVRVIARGSAGGTTIANQLDTFLLDTPNGGVGKSASRTYEAAGESITLSFSNPAPGSQNDVAVLIFGRRN